jgi:subtilisin family serine protease
VLHDLKHDQDVLWAELNGCVYASGVVPNDDFYQAQQWNLRLIGLPEAWALTTGNADPVAVIDTGISLDHPDLAAKIWTNVDEIADNGIDDDRNGYVDDVHGWNFVTGSTLIIGELHGTHVAGIAGAHTNNGIGVAGVSWRSSIMPLQALKGTAGSYAAVAEAIVYAADNGAPVLNLSLGGTAEEGLQTLKAAISYAQGQGCLLIAAVGNDGDTVLYPAALSGVLAVAASTARDSHWVHSNAGSEVDVAAPGVDIFSTSHNGYGIVSGTSMATPHVSGLADLIWSMAPELTSDQVAYAITSTAKDIYPLGWDQYTGWGRINAHAAVSYLQPYRSYLPSIVRHSSNGPQ